jgi:dienelactone hydrolase
MKSLLFGCLLPMMCSDLRASDTVRIEKIFKDDWAAYIHFPPAKGPLPVIITLGGSEGGLSFVTEEANRMAEEGFVVMRLGYFKYSKSTMSQTLKELRVEKVLDAIDWLSQRPEVDSTRIGLLGISKGAELALVVASKSPRVKAVAAHVPSHVVWYGLGERIGLNTSSWTWQGTPMPFVPSAKPKSGWFTKRIAEFYEAGLEKHPDKIPAATIRVEQIAGPVLVSSGGADDIWPSALMAEAVVQRLKAHNFPHEVKHLHYPAAGHAVFGALPDKNDNEAMEKLAFGGGTPIGNYEAREQSWQETMGFFWRGLGR